MKELLNDPIGYLVYGLLNVFADTMLDLVKKLVPHLLSIATSLFDIKGVADIIKLFQNLGWLLFGVGTVIAILDTAVLSSKGEADIGGTALNILKGLAVTSLFTVLPIHLFKFTVTLTTLFNKGWTSATLAEQLADSAGTAISNGLENLSSGQATSGQTAGAFAFGSLTQGFGILFFCGVVLYCVAKLFLQNVKRGGILLIQIAVGSLYMFGIPRGYQDGFISWCKQVIALCVTTFLQTTLIIFGFFILTGNIVVTQKAFQTLLLACGVMLSGNEVPRIAQTYGLDTSAKSRLSSGANTVRQFATGVKQLANK